MKKALHKSIVCLLLSSALSITSTFGLDKEDTYTLASGATKTTYSTKICFVYDNDEHVPTMENGSISGCY